ncbi:MAG TPA: Fic family protein [Saprospiraceae bacterium]|nr:Fic family protein [Saprospiraceae bacterium]
MTHKIEQFDAGHWEMGSGYKYFVPTRINEQWEWQSAELNVLLEKASFKLGELNAYAHRVPNISLFIRLHVTKEAVVSSRIEGTKTDFDEALLPEEEIDPERRDDWKEVNNYIRALNWAIEELDLLPLSTRLLRNTHQILLEGARGEHKSPGEFRSSQNWIGGRSLADAVFIPPAHHQLSALMGDLENFLHNENIQVPALIRIGIAHYQFETIHPFLDGNGRIGRLLIILFLVSQQLLAEPLLYLSAFFEEDRGLYYDNLMKVRKQNDLLQWLKYFLVGIAQTSDKATTTLSNLLDLKNDLEKRIKINWGRRISSGLQLINHLFEHPMIRVKTVEKVCKLSPKAANDLIASFVDTGILKEITGQSRNRVFIFESYIKLFE